MQALSACCPVLRQHKTNLCEFGNEAAWERIVISYALTRVWRSELFSWQLTRLMHKFPEHTGFDRKILRAEFDQLVMSEIASQKLAESHVGLSHGEY
jgi:hypothetical protein